MDDHPFAPLNDLIRAYNEEVARRDKIRDRTSTVITASIVLAGLATYYLTSIASLLVRVLEEGRPAWWYVAGFIFLALFVFGGTYLYFALSYVRKVLSPDRRETQMIDKYGRERARLLLVPPREGHAGRLAASVTMMYLHLYHGNERREQDLNAALSSLYTAVLLLIIAALPFFLISFA